MFGFHSSSSSPVHVLYTFWQLLNVIYGKVKFELSLCEGLFVDCLARNISLIGIRTVIFSV